MSSLSEYCCIDAQDIGYRKGLDSLEEGFVLLQLLGPKILREESCGKIWRLFSLS